jgi:hypothetical protein
VDDKHSEVDESSVPKQSQQPTALSHNREIRIKKRRRRKGTAIRGKGGCEKRHQQTPQRDNKGHTLYNFFFSDPRGRVYRDVGCEKVESQVRRRLNEWHSSQLRVPVSVDRPFSPRMWPDLVSLLLDDGWVRAEIVFELGLVVIPDELKKSIFEPHLGALSLRSWQPGGYMRVPNQSW